MLCYTFYGGWLFVSSLSASQIEIKLFEVNSRNVFLDFKWKFFFKSHNNLFPLRSKKTKELGLILWIRPQWDSNKFSSSEREYSDSSIPLAFPANATHNKYYHICGSSRTFLFAKTKALKKCCTLLDSSPDILPHMYVQYDVIKAGMWSTIKSSDKKISSRADSYDCCSSFVNRIVCI